MMAQIGATFNPHGVFLRKSTSQQLITKEIFGMLIIQKTVFMWSKIEILINLTSKT